MKRDNIAFAVSTIEQHDSQTSALVAENEICAAVVRAIIRYDDGFQQNSLEELQDVAEIAASIPFMSELHDGEVTPEFLIIDAARSVRDLVVDDELSGRKRRTMSDEKKTIATKLIAIQRMQERQLQTTS